MGVFTALLKGVTVEPVLFLYMLGSFVSFGTFQKLLNYKVCYLRYLDHYACLEPKGAVESYVQTEGSYWLMYCNIALYVPSVLVACYLGAWGDVYGRKPPLLISGTATLFSYVIYTYAATFADSSLFVLILSNFVSGLGGGFIVFIASAMSYVSDVTTIEARTSRVAVLESMVFVGGTVGPLVSAYLLNGSGYANTFLFCVVCNFLVIVYVAMFLKDVSPISKVVLEPLTNEATLVTRPPSVRLLSFSYFYEGLVTCFKKREGNNRLYIVLVFLACISMFFVFAVELDLTYLYVTGEPLRWPYMTYSIYQSVKTGLGSLFLLVGLPWLRHKFNFQDTTLVFIGLTSRAVGLVVLAFSTTTVMMFLVPVFSIFGMFQIPCYRSMLSKLVNSTEQGKMFSVLATVENLCSVFASMFYNSLYPLTRPILHGFCFLVAVGLVGVSSLLTSYLFVHKRRHDAVRYEDLSVQDGESTGRL